uniref:Transthyretin n=1 Tax=Anser cygnoides TaxID=8845 RepID=A0A8B9DVF1_ANSCY
MLIYLSETGQGYWPDSSDSMHPLVVKILDSVRGSPAPNVPVKLYKAAADGSWELLNSKQTNKNRELRELTTKEQFKLVLNPFHQHADVSIHFTLPAPGFRTHWELCSSPSQCQSLHVVFTANDADYRYYSIATLLSPFSYSTTAVASEPVE